MYKGDIESVIHFSGPEKQRDRLLGRTMRTDAQRAGSLKRYPDLILRSGRATIFHIVIIIQLLPSGGCRAELALSCARGTGCSSINRNESILFLTYQNMRICRWFAGLSIGNFFFPIPPSLKIIIQGSTAPCTLKPYLVRLEKQIGVTDGIGCWGER